jgi:hypothetical protein
MKKDSRKRDRFFETSAFSRESAFARSLTPHESRSPQKAERIRKLVCNDFMFPYGKLSFSPV